MSNPFIGEIRMVGFNFAPQSWAVCDGATQSIAQNSTLFNLIGTTYGGDGQTTFKLPDLQGRIPIHQAPEYVIGQLGGSEDVTLTTNELPDHDHALQASTGAATRTNPTGHALAAAAVDVYSPLNANGAGLVTTSSVSTVTGGSQPHDNLMPFLCVMFIIALFGVYPSQN